MTGERIETRLEMAGVQNADALSDLLLACLGGVSIGLSGDVVSSRVLTITANSDAEFEPVALALIGADPAGAPAISAGADSPPRINRQGGLPKKR